MSYASHTRILLLVWVCACRGDPAPAARGPTIELALDDAVRTVAIDRAISLTSLVSAPPARWIEVRADTRDGRWLEVPAPTTTYPGGELRLYVERDRVAIGVFVGDRAVAVLSPIARVRVATHLPAPGITIVAAGGARTWTGTARETPLADVLGAPAPRGVHIAGETEITLATVDNAVIKANARGEYVLRVWDNGRTHPTQEIRRVTKIVVE